LQIDGVEVSKMTVMDMRRKIKRERPAGTREEFVVRTQGSAVRHVVVIYEEKKEPNKALEPTPTVRGFDNE